MKLEALRELLRARPFRPFNIHLADGRHFSLLHPDYLALPPEGNLAFVYDFRGIPSMVDLDLVTSINVVPPVAVA